MEFQTHRALGETGAVTPAHLNIPSPPPFCLIEMEPRNKTETPHCKKYRLPLKSYSAQSGIFFLFFFLYFFTTQFTSQNRTDGWDDNRTVAHANEVVCRCDLPYLSCVHGELYSTGDAFKALKIESFFYMFVSIQPIQVQTAVCSTRCDGYVCSIRHE